MSQFLGVTGDDPFYKSRSTFLYLAISSIQKIYPLYGIKTAEDKTYARCIPTAKGAQLVAYHIYDFAGQKYIAGKEQVEALGLKPPPEKTITGFTTVSGDNISVDSTQE